MRKLIILFALLLGFNTFAKAADSTVAAMTAASALSGPELFYCVQGSADRKCTATQLQTFIQAALLPAGSSGDIQTNNGSGGFGSITPASGIAAWLATPNSTNLKAAMTDETGNGVLVFGTSPTLTTPHISSIVNIGTLTLPTSTDTLVGKATTDTLTNKTFDTSGTGNSFSIAGVAVSANTGTGAIVRTNSPTLTTPTINTATMTGGLGSASAIFTAGTGSQQYVNTSGFVARGPVNEIEFGHLNTGGYGSVIGADNTAGNPWICFSCGGGTNVNTYKTFGLKGSIVKGDLAGGILFQTVPTASADNQSPTNIAFIDTQGAFGLPKLSGAPASAPGAGKCFIFAVAGTNAGSGKLQAQCGTSTTAVTILDNIGTGF